MKRLVHIYESQQKPPEIARSLHAQLSYIVSEPTWPASQV